MNATNFATSSDQITNQVTSNLESVQQTTRRKKCYTLAKATQGPRYFVAKHVPSLQKTIAPKFFNKNAIVAQPDEREITQPSNAIATASLPKREPTEPLHAEVATPAAPPSPPSSSAPSLVIEPKQPIVSSTTDPVSTETTHAVHSQPDVTIEAKEQPIKLTYAGFLGSIDSLLERTRELGNKYVQNFRGEGLGRPHLNKAKRINAQAYEIQETYAKFFKAVNPRNFREGLAEDPKLQEKLEAPLNYFLDMVHHELQRANYQFLSSRGKPFEVKKFDLVKEFNLNSTQQNTETPQIETRAHNDVSPSISSISGEVTIEQAINQSEGRPVHFSNQVGDLIKEDHQTVEKTKLTFTQRMRSVLRSLTTRFHPQPKDKIPSLIRKELKSLQKEIDKLNDRLEKEKARPYFSDDGLLPDVDKFLTKFHNRWTLLCNNFLSKIAEKVRQEGRRIARKDPDSQEKFIKEHLQAYLELVQTKRRFEEQYSKERLTTGYLTYRSLHERLFLLKEGLNKFYRQSKLLSRGSLSKKYEEIKLPKAIGILDELTRVNIELNRPDLTLQERFNLNLKLRKLNASLVRAGLWEE